MTVKELVQDCLANAEDNGYSMNRMSAEQLAWELIAYVDDFEEADYDEVVQIIESIRQECKNA
jgi:hypothetical protein